MAIKNKQIVYVKPPGRTIGPESFAVRQQSAAPLADGQVLIENKYLSLDPYMRMRLMGGAANDALNTVMEGRIVGRVAASNHPKLSEGDSVFAMGAWETHSVVNGDDTRHIDVTHTPWTAYLGVLGFTGLTAHAGLLHYGKLQSGETLFVSAASGAVGSVVGQIAKIRGLRVTGCAGTDEKVSWLMKDLAFDGAFNHRATIDYEAAVADINPNGIDVNFENVGGDIFNAVFNKMNTGGRLIICGGISQYNRTVPQPAVPNLLDFITKKLEMRGFTVRDHAHEINDYIDQARDWVRDGKLKSRETIVDGLENAPAAFASLFRGENFGKLIVRIRK